MTLKNDLGHTHQTDRGDDVMNALDEFDGRLTLAELAEELAESLFDVRRFVERLEQDSQVVCDKEEPNWIVEVAR